MQKIREKTVTGEWIIFHKHNGLNYYLTLGSHLEDDAAIFARVALACKFDKMPFKFDT